MVKNGEVPLGEFVVPKTYKMYHLNKDRNRIETNFINTEAKQYLLIFAENVLMFELTFELIITHGQDLQEAVNWVELINAALSTDPQPDGESPDAVQVVVMPSVGPASDATQEEDMPNINPAPDVEMPSVSASPDASQHVEMPSEGAAPDAMVEDVYTAPTVEVNCQSDDVIYINTRLGG
ncbi:Hypp8218 [Branchiostoma lanceolatum]|uniref:Hypp8218 protein n=1 Tax=Branchiostoma lanceolatum TaxID=7740 RepID=A0A8J9Z7E0_BRALA|nr:Hypp8218 [Branchiostoma lanceolatum]